MLLKFLHSKPLASVSTLVNLGRLPYLLVAAVTLTCGQPIALTQPKPVTPAAKDAHCANRSYAMFLNSLAISPDGKTAFSSIFDSAIYRWDLTTDKPGQILANHQDMVYALALSPDGSRLVSGGSDGVIRVWQAADGKLLQTMPASDVVYALKISPDGNTLVSGDSNKDIKIWQMETGKLVRTLQGHDQEVVSLAFTPDGKTLASGSYETVKLWDMATGRNLRTLTWRNPRLSSGSALVAITPDGKTVIAGSSLTQLGTGQNAIYSWELATGKPRTHLAPLIDDWVYGIAITPDGKTLVTGNFGLTTWDLTTGKITSRQFTSPTGENDVVSLAMAADGKTLLLATGRKGLKLWDLASRKITRVLLDNCPEPKF